ncbi:Uncharacterized protein PECH_005306 [Penicillium ucsense]|uniref:NAP family protein n=1 Tax=Penicillium ucsense TaxID=2839758 RepID=A0A8J8W3N3_9EURO|nr:Uncharacterized protein PECM_005707 [Penicillium ucsense]KAF7736452.1 Uncharacterized protein PECH_005306 [Penicillium ucsense]
MSGEDKSLSERIEFPAIPEEARSKISHVQEELERAELEQLRKSIPLFAPIFKKREEIISMPGVKSDFWARVFSTAPSEISEFILESDSEILAENLKNVVVERFEVDAEGNGEPRSLRFTFEFETENNEFFDNAKLVKEFYWRKHVQKTAKGKRRAWEGLVSDPVRINWKSADVDPTRGLLDAACDLFDAEKKKGGKRTDLPEYEALVKKLEIAEAEAMQGADIEDMEDLPEDEDDSPAGASFFSFFAYRGRDVSAEQNKEALKEDEERWAKIARGEEVPEDDDEEDDDEEEDFDLVDDLEEAEVFPGGEDLAIAIAEDLWTNALKYYAESFQPSFDFEDEFEELEDMDEDEDDVDDGEDQPPAKKARN